MIQRLLQIAEVGDAETLRGEPRESQRHRFPLPARDSVIPTIGFFCSVMASNRSRRAPGFPFSAIFASRSSSILRLYDARLLILPIS
jgi:hypothetical protein